MRPSTLGQTLILCLATSLLSLGCGGTETASSADQPGLQQWVATNHNLSVRFSRLIVDDQAGGPAFAAVGDLNGDGRDDLVVSHLGRVNGTTIEGDGVSIYTQGVSINEWSKEAVKISPPATGRQSQGGWQGNSDKVKNRVTMGWVCRFLITDSRKGYQLIVLIKYSP